MALGLGLGLGLSRRGSSAPSGPTDIALSAATIEEGAAQGTAIGTLSATGGTAPIVFTLTDDAGGCFQIDGTSLEAGAVATDFETAASHQVTVRATDANNLTYDENFIITVTDASEFAIADLPTLMNRWTADSLSDAEGALVSGPWEDTGPSGEDASTNTTARPTMRASVADINSKKALEFDGSDYFQLSNYLGDEGLDGTDGLTAVWVVSKFSDPSAGTADSNPPLHLNAATGGSAHYPFTDGVIYHLLGTSARKTTSNPSFDLTGWHIFVTRSKTNLYNLRLNGAEFFNTTTNTFMTPTTVPYIGSDGVQFFKGKAAQIVTFKSYLDDETIEKVEGELAHYYALTGVLPVDHPYKSSPP